MVRFSDVEGLLPGYLSADITDKDRAIVDEWLKESTENEILFHEIKTAWESIPLLNEMEQFNSFDALKKVNLKLPNSNSRRWWRTLQHAAAILLLPLLVYSGYLTFKDHAKYDEQMVMQTVTSRQGMVSRLVLADGTKVWLNSGSELQFPIRFEGLKREVHLKGEAFFEVTKNEKQPFRVNTSELKVEVLGTSFNVVNFDDDSQSEVVLVTGKVQLTSENGVERIDFGPLHPGQRAVYEKGEQKVTRSEVEVEKYTSWRNGTLIFREDSMHEVAKRLSRWFNVEIEITDPEIESYVYKATFRDESLIQVLNLLKLSGPVDYRISQRKNLPNGEFAKQKVSIMKRKS